MRSSPAGRFGFGVLLVAAFLLAGPAGCSKEEPVNRPVVQKMAPKPGTHVAAKKASPLVAEKKPAVLALYNPVGKRDPFVPFLKAEPKLRAKQNLASLPPLQRYDLGELKFVGVIWAKNGARALVEDAEGKGYSVFVGTRIGREGGVVTRITENEIVVREEFTGVGGGKVHRENVLQLTTAGGKE
jgi:Tfp pilus assembly protein PilP